MPCVNCLSKWLSACLAFAHQSLHLFSSLAGACSIFVHPTPLFSQTNSPLSFLWPSELEVCLGQSSSTTSLCSLQTADEDFLLPGWRIQLLMVASRFALPSSSSWWPNPDCISRFELLKSCSLRHQVCLQPCCHVRSARCVRPPHPGWAAATADLALNSSGLNISLCVFHYLLRNLIY